MGVRGINHTLIMARVSLNPRLINYSLMITKQTKEIIKENMINNNKQGRERKKNYLD